MHDVPQPLQSVRLQAPQEREQSVQSELLQRSQLCESSSGAVQPQSLHSTPDQSTSRT